MSSVIARLPVGQPPQYTGSCPKFSEPQEVACFSRDASRAVKFDRSSLRRYSPPPLPAALDVGFEDYRPKDNADEPAPLGDVLGALAAHKYAVTSGAVVTFRNNLNKLMLTPYNPRDDWEIGVGRHADGSVRLVVRETSRKAAEEARRGEREKRMVYWGYKFEGLSTSDRGGSPATSPSESTIPTQSSQKHRHSSAYPCLPSHPSPLSSIATRAARSSPPSTRPLTAQTPARPSGLVSAPPRPF